MKCWHKWVVTERKTPCNDGDIAAVTCFLVGICGFLSALPGLAVWNVTESVAFGWFVGGGLFVTLLASVIAWLYRENWTWADAACVKCHRVWLGLTIRKEGETRQRELTEKSLQEAKDLVESRKVMWRKGLE